MDWKSATPGAPNFFDKTFKNWVFGLKTPGHFLDFLGDHFARVESSGDQHLTVFILHFHDFFHF